MQFSISSWTHFFFEFVLNWNTTKMTKCISERNIFFYLDRISSSIPNFLEFRRKRVDSFSPWNPRLYLEVRRTWNRRPKNNNNNIKSVIKQKLIKQKQIRNLKLKFTKWKLMSCLIRDEDKITSFENMPKFD